MPPPLPAPEDREEHSQREDGGDDAGTGSARAALSQKDLVALVHVSNDVISKIETGERPPAEDFPPRQP